MDHNQMAELAHLKRSRGWGRRKDGINKTVSTKAFYDNQMRDLSPWQRLVFETKTRWKQTCEIHKAHFQVDCFRSREGFSYAEEIPF
jgi:hypothetical protein